MSVLNNRLAKAGLIALALAAIAVNVFLFRQGNTAGAASLRGGAGRGEVSTAAPVTYRDYDLGGKAPGNPQQTIEQMRKLYGYLDIYRKRHDGVYPSANALGRDRVINPGAYGFSDGPQANMALHNPDMKYSDSVQGSAHPETYEPYVIVGVRPDGAPVGSPKSAGTRDVLAFTEMYYHRNIRYLKGGDTSSKPSGFYLVLWDDGQVEQVAWDKAKFLGPQGGYPFPTVFDGQAGLPSTGVHTHDEYEKWTYQRALAN